MLCTVWNIWNLLWFNHPHVILNIAWFYCVQHKRSVGSNLALDPTDFFSLDTNSWNILQNIAFFCMFCRRKQAFNVWHSMRVSKWWQMFYSWAISLKNRHNGIFVNYFILINCINYCRFCSPSFHFFIKFALIIISTDNRLLDNWEKQFQ